VARLLVVEDDQTIGQVLRDSLGQHGHDVRWRQTGRDALRDAEGHTFDLALVDLGLPDLDGTEVCRRFREIQPACGSHPGWRSNTLSRHELGIPAVVVTVGTTRHLVKH
jgi:CheY-like chemotaxis protein